MRASTHILLALVCVLAFAVRLFPVVRWGNVIHEYDPHFNYRVSRLLDAYGSLALRDWFDDRVWYPLGRSVGETLYPGLMVTAVAIQWISTVIFRMPISTRVACVFVAPIFASFACIAIFLFTLQVTKRRGPALVAAALFSISPAYISRSTAGSFDNEGVAIFQLVLTFWLWVRSVHSGSMFDASLAALSYFSMVVSWGGYVFITNLVPLHVLALVLSGRYSAKVYIAYSTFYPLATLLSMLVPFVAFNTITKAESAASHAIFAGLQLFAFVRWLQSQLSADHFTKFLRTIALGVGAVATLLIAVAMLLGKLQWSGRSLTLLDPTYASKYIPIIASVGEHQPPPWAGFYLSLGPMVLLAPLGLFYCFEKLDEGYLFVIIYSSFSFYFAGIMVRLMLTLAPAACVLSAVGASEIMDKVAVIMHRQDDEEKNPTPAEEPKSEDAKPDLKRKKKSAAQQPSNQPPVPEWQRIAQEELAARKTFWVDLWNAYGPRFSFSRAPQPRVKALDLSGVMWLLLVALACLFLIHLRHAAKVTSLAYSSTSMVFEGRDKIYDDYREAYAWLRANAEPDAKILGWWDYGYQISALSNRTVLVDNNTWNNTHIATVGRVLTSSEDAAWPILQSLDVDYVFIVFGGRVGMSGDDLGKLPWILRITQDVFRNEVMESEFTVNGDYIYDSDNATTAMKESIVYKMSYYRFLDEPQGDAKAQEYIVDKNRGAKTLINARDIQLTRFEEAFTSEGWIVRIYRVKKDAGVARLG